MGPIPINRFASLPIPRPSLSPLSELLPHSRILVSATPLRRAKRLVSLRNLYGKEVIHRESKILREGNKKSGRRQREGRKKGEAYASAQLKSCACMREGERKAMKYSVEKYLATSSRSLCSIIVLTSSFIPSLLTSLSPSPPLLLPIRPPSRTIIPYILCSKININISKLIYDGVMTHRRGERGRVYKEDWQGLFAFQPPPSRRLICVTITFPCTKLLFISRSVRFKIK